MIARALGKTIRVGLGTAAVWGSIQGFLSLISDWF